MATSATIVTVHTDHIPVPSNWPRHAANAVRLAVALAHWGLVWTRTWCVNSRVERIRLRGEVDRLETEVALLKEEIRIKDARLARIPPPNRPRLLAASCSLHPPSPTGSTASSTMASSLMRREVALFVEWYNDHRPHTSLRGATPQETYLQIAAARDGPRFECREKWPLGDGVTLRTEQGAAVQLAVSFLERRRHLPVVALERAA